MSATIFQHLLWTNYKSFKGRYILGLIATPIEKMNLQPILFQQLGKFLMNIKKKNTQNKLKIIRTGFSSNADNYATIINELCVDEN